MGKEREGEEEGIKGNTEERGKGRREERGMEKQPVKAKVN